MSHCGMLVSENLVKYTSSKIYFHSISTGSHGFGDSGCLYFFESMILIQKNHAVIFLGQGAHDTSRYTIRVLAVHALDLDESGYQQISLVKLSGIVTVYYSVACSTRPSLALEDTPIIKWNLGSR